MKLELRGFAREDNGGAKDLLWKHMTKNRGYYKTSIGLTMKNQKISEAFRASSGGHRCVTSLS
jgi:hypothetical protein